MHPRNGRDFQLLDLPARFTNTMDVERELDGILNCIRPEAGCNGGYDGKDIAIGRKSRRRMIVREKVEHSVSAMAIHPRYCSMSLKVSRVGTSNNLRLVN